MKITANTGLELSCPNLTKAYPKTSVLDDYLDQLKVNGFVVIPFNSNNNIELAIAALGKQIMVTEIRENPSSTRLLASNQKMGFHTDHFAAKWMAWFCNSQSAIGGESLLIDVHQIIRAYSPEKLNILSQVMVNSHQVFYKDPKFYPLFQKVDHNWAIFYSDWLLQEPTNEITKRVLKEFKLDLENAIPIELKLSEGEILVIDNHRMLHGRKSFPQNSNRWLTRYWIQ